MKRREPRLIRTFSRFNYDPAQPVGSSGGPSAEHCYTSGLLLHYRLTGDRNSAEAVLELAAWIRAAHDGDKTLLARLVKVRRHEVQNILALLSRRRANPYRYQINRGTGNLIVALLDAFDLSEDRDWLDTAEKVLQSTFHPEDTISERELDDIERGWSYTVFLQSVLRYLAVKEALGETDASYLHALSGFLAYLDWMLAHERPYLDTPERLEFPNDTWAAQDIRKHGLLIAAAAYNPLRAKEYLEKATDFEAHVLLKLRASDSRHFSRIQILILWNLGIASHFSNTTKHISTSSINEMIPPAPRRTILSELISATREVMMAFLTFNPVAEVRWLRLRM